MAQAINLLPQIAEKEVKQGVYKRKINLVAIVSLLATASVALGLFAYQLVLTTQARALENNTKRVEERIKEKFELEVKQRALVDKLDAVAAYLDKNKSTAKAFRRIIDLANSGKVALSKVDFGSGGAIIVTGTAANSTNLGSFFDNLTAENPEATVTLEKPIANTISVSAAQFQFTIRVNYGNAPILDQVVEEFPTEEVVP